MNELRSDGNPSAGQHWNADKYATDAAYVAALGLPVVELLAPQPGERILDLGCGDGALSATIAARGCSVVGVDASKEMVAAARERGIDARCHSGDALEFDNEFDAVFSNAALHWMTNYDRVVACVFAALRPGGRFVGELGGAGNVQTIVTAIREVTAADQRLGAFRSPWFFPTPEEYRASLEAGGFAVTHIELIPRPTPLPAGLRSWLEIFADHATTGLEAPTREAFLDAVEKRCRPHLYSPSDGWVADYVRLRFRAVKPTGTECIVTLPTGT